MAASAVAGYIVEYEPSQKGPGTGVGSTSAVIGCARFTPFGEEFAGFVADVTNGC